MLNFTTLQSTLRTLDHHFKIEAGKSVNRLLTIRNWLFGFYIVEFQQNGEDRAAYGEKLLLKLAKSLKIKGLSHRNLKLFRQFYLVYPDLKVPISSFINNTRTGQILISQLENQIGQTVSAQLQIIGNEDVSIGQSVSAQLTQMQTGAPPKKIINQLSFSHITLLLAFDDALKRAFYEIEAIRGSWTVRELRRQIKTMLYERTGLSKDKTSIIRKAHEYNEVPNPADYFRSPYIFDFLNLPRPNTFEENELEQALIDHLQTFLLELGEGFCFEARQKRILLGKEWHFVDLVFYHRILRCHVLIDLKTEAFQPSFTGNMNAYLNYYRDEIQHPQDNLPIGLILCTDKDEAVVRYAISGMDEKLFVSQYKVKLPDEATLKAFIERERDLLVP